MKEGIWSETTPIFDDYTQKYQFWDENGISDNFWPDKGIFENKKLNMYDGSEFSQRKGGSVTWHATAQATTNQTRGGTNKREGEV